MTSASLPETPNTYAEVLIRRARAEDAEQIGETRVRSWQAAYGAFLPSEFLLKLDPNANLDGLRQLLNSEAPLPIVTVAEVGSMVRGFSILGTSRSPASNAALELWALNVHPDYWRAGLATRLVMQITQIHPTTDIELWCLQGNLPAEALYQRCGFHKTGEERTTQHLTGQPLTECRFVRMSERGAS
jgi:GNAT superfamily N-acetyltransferase